MDGPGLRARFALDFHIHGPVHAQVPAQELRRGGPDLIGAGERAQGIAQFQQERLPLLALAQCRLGPIGADLRAGVHRHVEQAGHLAMLGAHRGVGEVPPRLLRVAVARHHQRHLLEPHRLAGEHARHQRFDLLPDIGPRLAKRQAKRGGMPGPASVRKRRCRGWCAPDPRQAAWRAPIPARSRRPSSGSGASSRSSRGGSPTSHAPQRAAPSRLRRAADPERNVQPFEVKLTRGGFVPVSLGRGVCDRSSASLRRAGEGENGPGTFLIFVLELPGGRRI